MQQAERKLCDLRGRDGGMGLQAKGRQGLPATPAAARGRGSMAPQHLDFRILASRAVR